MYYWGDFSEIIILVILFANKWSFHKNKQFPIFGRMKPTVLLLLALLLTTAAFAQSEKQLRILSYNIHHGKTADNVDQLAEMADYILQSGADIVGLQEVDSVCTRSAKVDQTAFLGEKTGMHHAFVRHFPYQGGAYGLAFLSKYPILSVENHPLPAQSESLGATVALMIVTLEISATDTIRVVNVHLDYRSQDSRLEQSKIMAAILENLDLPLVVMGDLNAVPQTAEIESLKGRLGLIETHAPSAFTFPTALPDRKIDYILVDPRFFKLVASAVPDIHFSDHRPIVSDVLFTASGGSRL